MDGHIARLGEMRYRPTYKVTARKLHRKETICKTIKMHPNEIGRDVLY
jgi:hypothetical protein